MAKQFDALGFFGEWPALLRPAPGTVSGAEGYHLDDDYFAVRAELFEEWDRQPRGLGALTSTEEDPAVEMLEMGLRDAD